MLVMRLKECFPRSERVFDAFSPFFAWANNLRISRAKTGVPCRWALKHPWDLETWADGLHLLEAWSPFMQPEPRLAHIGWARHLPLTVKTIGIFRYSLA